MGLRMKGGERRAAIVTSAIRLFAEKGFRGATTRELAAGLGVTEPVLYQHFRTKRDLYRAIIETKAAEASEQAAALLRLAREDDDRAFFTTLGETILERYQSDPDTFRLLYYSCLENDELAELFFDRLVLDLYKLVSGYIRRRIRAGAFRKVNPQIAARGVIGMLSYHGQIALLYPGRFGRQNRRRVAAELVEVFLHGIAGAAPIDSYHNPI